MKIGVPGTVHKPGLSRGFHWQQVLQHKTENCHSPVHALLLYMSAFQGVLESKGLGSNLSSSATWPILYPFRSLILHL